MADISSISGSFIPIGNNPPGGKKYSKPQQSHAPRQGAEKLRPGEIVLGSIVETINNRESMVRLPIGTLRAYLIGRLRPGDTLYFKVEQIEPNLVLKIHSVPVSSGGKELSTLDILRILNLPNNEFYTALTEYLKTFQIRIKVETALWFWRAFTGLKDATVRKTTLDSVFSVFRFFYENKLLTSDELFTALHPFIAEFDTLASIFNELHELLPGSEKSERAAQLFAALSMIVRKQLKLSELVKSCAGSPDSRANLLTLLGAVATDETGQIETRALRLATRAYSILESQSVFNRLAIAEGFAAEYLIPFYFKNAFIVVKMKLHGSQSKDKTASRTFFTLTMPTEALGTIVAECSLVENIVSVELDTDSDQAMAALGAHRGELVQMLARDGFANANVTITMKSKSSNLPQEEVQGGREKVISVVV